VTKSEHICYLSGFSGADSALLITRDARMLVSDSRYTLQAAQQAPDWEFIQVKDALPDALRGLLTASGCAKIGVESEDISLRVYQQLGGDDATSPYRLQPTSGIIARLRLVKDEDELAAIRSAARITDAAYAHLVSKVHPGITEAELALEAEWYMRRHGADGLAFATIVATGDHCALPHAQPGARSLQAGDLVVVDMGARVAQYCADLTRTFAVTTAPPIAQEIYRLCLAAQLAGLAHIRSGMTGREADYIVREVIDQAGYGDHFGHGTGHGIGLEIHEAPRLSRLSEEILPVGATVTVEPGIYLADMGGVRIEDSVLVRETDVEALTAAPKPATLPVYG
jgi:Xaa-Pro aminopeptidase